MPGPGGFWGPSAAGADTLDLNSLIKSRNLKNIERIRQERDASEFDEQRDRAGDAFAELESELGGWGTKATQADTMRSNLQQLSPRPSNGRYTTDVDTGRSVGGIVTTDGKYNPELTRKHDVVKWERTARQLRGMSPKQIEAYIDHPSRTPEERAWFINRFNTKKKKKKNR